MSATAALPIVCAWCERVRCDADHWQEAGLEALAGEATHGICPECLATQTREAMAGAELR